MLTHRQLPPNEQDSVQARLSEGVLARYVQSNRPLVVQVSNQEQRIELPPKAVNLLLEILQAMAAGRSVTILPENAELTTVQAAAILNVSRPFLIKLLENGTIPYHKINTHRRIQLEDVLNYKEAIDLEREGVLDQLMEEAQTLDLGY